MLTGSKTKQMKHVQALLDFVTTSEQGPNSHKIQYVTESDSRKIQ